MAKNFDNIFFREVGIALTITLNKRMMYINRFENKNIRVAIPFYMPFTGDANFIFDAFNDDIVDRRVETNVDKIPRGVVELKDISVVSSELANPNQYISKKTVLNDKMIEIISKVKAVKVEMSYDIKIILSNENDILKVSEKLLNVLYNYMFISVDYFGLKIDAFFQLPDSKTIDFKRDIGFDQNSTKKEITYQLKIETFYPIFQIDVDDFEVCDNDDEIDWDYLGIRRPDLNTPPNLIKRVFWDNNLYLLNNKLEREQPNKYHYIDMLNNGSSVEEIEEYYNYQISISSSDYLKNFYSSELNNFNTLLIKAKKIK